MQKFLVTFDIHGGDQGSNIYAEIYKDIRQKYGKEGFCKDFGQFFFLSPSLSFSSIPLFFLSTLPSNSNSGLSSSRIGSVTARVWR
ncbi:hypothetical protein [Gluconobacter sp. P5E10]|uniref:hypothetical protein n=1 Tax=Gluconobacter sp. P5E10 TaxID=2762613 RepID=UPI001C04B29E|nr:hypothetical protein [Gluconobacter sp. P5E10]